MMTSTSLLRGLLLATLLLFAAPGRAEPHVCTLLKAADVTPLLGVAVEGKPNAGACAWQAPGSPRKLVAARMRATGAKAEMAYAGAHDTMGKDPDFKIVELTGVGDKAFAVPASFGVALYAMKGGRILQLQYLAGARGTAKDVEALRRVGKKAAAAL
jgi:hypothetical protein